MIRGFQAITNLTIQGATGVAFATLELLKKELKKLPWPAHQPAFKKIAAKGQRLGSLRPTEPLTRNLIKWILIDSHPLYNLSNNQLKFNKQINELFIGVIKYYNGLEDYIINAAVKKIKMGAKIFTHCHSSLVEKILVKAKQSSKRINVYHTETRPLFQGRITERKMRQANIKSFLVADSAAAYLVSNHSGDNIKIDLVILGADALLADGSVLNKIGSFGIALAAYESKIPVYVASSLLKFDIDSTTKIEMRKPQELWPNRPRHIKILNYAFDRIPSKLISGIICEAGVIRSQQISNLAKKHYSKLFKKILWPYN